jgi:hypothetical protein
MTVPQQGDPPHGYPPPGWVQQLPGNPTRSNWMGYVALGCGIGPVALGVIAALSESPSLISVVLAVGLPCIILAIVFGAMGMSRGGRGEATNRGTAIAGLVIGILDVVLVMGLGLLFMLWMLGVAFSHL